MRSRYLARRRFLWRYLTSTLQGSQEFLATYHADPSEDRLQVVDYSVLGHPQAAAICSRPAVKHRANPMVLVFGGPIPRSEERQKRTIPTACITTATRPPGSWSSKPPCITTHSPVAARTRQVGSGAAASLATYCAAIATCKTGTGNTPPSA